MSWVRYRNYCPPCPDRGSGGGTPSIPPNQARVNIGAVQIIGTDCTGCDDNLTACIITSNGCLTAVDTSVYGSPEETVSDTFTITLEEGYDTVRYQHSLGLICQIPTIIQGPLCFFNTGSQPLTIEEITIQIFDNNDTLLGETTETLSETVPPITGKYSTPFTVNLFEPLDCGVVVSPLRVFATIVTTEGSFTGGHPFDCQPPSVDCSFCATDGMDNYTISPGQSVTTFPLETEPGETDYQTTFTLSQVCGGEPLGAPIVTNLDLSFVAASLSVIGNNVEIEISVVLASFLDYDKFFSYTLYDSSNSPYFSGTIVVPAFSTDSDGIVTDPNLLSYAIITPTPTTRDLSL